MKTGKLINKLSGRLKRRSGEIQRDIGLNGTQGAILDFILAESAERAVYQRDIEKEFGLRPSSVTELLQTMEAKKLIRRIPDENDARWKKIVFTPEAESSREILKREIDETEALLLKGISEDEQETFLRLAGKMLKNLEEADETPGRSSPTEIKSAMKIPHTGGNYDRK